MLHVNKRLPQGRGLAPALLPRAATVELDFAGRRLGVFLPRGQVLRGGDVLVVENGSLVRGSRRRSRSCE
jgi:urease accessory protein